LDEAARRGDVEKVQLLLGDCTLDVNWHNEGENGFAPLHQACFYDHFPVVKALVSHPNIDVNLPMRLLATPLYIASQGNHKEIVQLLVDDPRVDVNLARDERATPVFIACQRGHLDTFDILMQDDRVDLNFPMNHGMSPLWIASCEGNLHIVQRLLASGRPVDPLVVSGPGPEGWKGKSVVDVAQWASHQDRLAWEIHDSEQERRRENCPIIADLVTTFIVDPVGVRTRLQCEPHIRGECFSQPPISPTSAHTLMPSLGVVRTVHCAVVFSHNFSL